MYDWVYKQPCLLWVHVVNWPILGDASDMSINASNVQTCTTFINDKSVHIHESMRLWTYLISGTASDMFINAM